jgi:hypothetical protein
MDALRDVFSDTASMTKSSDDRVEDDISPVVDTRDLISLDSANVNRSLCTSLFSNVSGLSRLALEYPSTQCSF